MEWWISGLILLLAFCGLWVVAGHLVQAALGMARPHGYPPFVSILLVVKNKAQIIEGLTGCLVRLKEYLPPGAPDYEVVVVDDGSIDETPRILERMARRFPNLRLVRMGEVGAAPEQSAADIGLFLCRSKVVLFFQVSGAVTQRTIMDAVRYLFGAGPERGAKNWVKPGEAQLPG